MYKILVLNERQTIVEIETNLNIPADEKNSDYQKYLAWVSEGNEPELEEIEE